MEKFKYVVSNKVGYEIVELNGKTYHIPQEEIENNMKILDLNKDEAIQMYLEDEGYIINQEQEELNTKAKGVVKPQAGDKTKRKPREKVQKENPTKEMIIAEIAKSLQALGVENLKIENKAKLITFNYVNESFKVDLVQKRKPKA